MLHELLLSLSGHPSALFDAALGSAHVTTTNTSTPTPNRLLSPPEAELLSSIGHLSRLHRRIRDHVAAIAHSHPSTVCRAVASAVASHHLHRFQHKVLEVESHILKQDAITVGAYNIVPLAALVSDFSDWTRLMEWLWVLSSFILPPDRPLDDTQTHRQAASGADLIDKLRAEAQTGYPDVEEAARFLGTVADASWLRQLSAWLLYGRLPSFGASDFFIQHEDVDQQEKLFVIHNALLPKFVTRQTASSILFVGKSLHQIRSLPSVASTSDDSRTYSELDILPSHIEHLSQVSVPVSAAKLSEVVAAIRLSLSRNLLRYLLPRERIIEILTVLHQFFLLGRGEFAISLISESDITVSSRHRNLPVIKEHQKPTNVLVKEAEINQILARSFSRLATSTGVDVHTDDVLDVATRLLHFTNHHHSTSNRPGTPGRAKDIDSALPRLTGLAFDDLLLSIPTLLTMDIQSPLDLFITKADLEVYSSINACLLAVRRAHLHLTQLWRQSSIRRDHPCPPGYQYSNSTQGRLILKRRRQRTTDRNRKMRRVWATCAAAIFFLAESEAYFQGAVIQQSFDHFLAWVTGSLPQKLHESQPWAPSSQTLPEPEPNEVIWQPHDPESLATAHRHFLSAIAHSLLLNDLVYTKTLRTFCAHVEELVALVTRLSRIQQDSDLEEDEGIGDSALNHRKEEQIVNVELDRSRRRLDSDLKVLVERLREIDNERINRSAPSLVDALARTQGGFEPLRAGGIDRLLIKLDWTNENDEEEHEDLL
ncbi:Spc98 family protein [Pyrenochaeta sp. DS3sAY3a]|nr:Spc98 family protein [Pyrenochaeta sp. DS3sAY3a]